MAPKIAALPRSPQARRYHAGTLLGALHAVLADHPGSETLRRLAPVMQRRQAAALLAAGGLSGCSLLWRPSNIKMDVLYDDTPVCTAVQAPVLLVLLPGANMATAELQREGFFDAVRQKKLAVDVIAADAHLGYLYDGSMLRRLHDDVIAPARAQGYRRIWLAGISLGGFVAMGYALKHPGQIEGLFVMAPYVGRRPLLQAVVAAGGPQAWVRSAQPRDAKDVEHEVWAWLAAPPAGAPPVYLGYGREDRFAEGHRVMATALPTDRVSLEPGGHDWPPWRALWAGFLARGLLPTRCAA
jgi:pimeloyl-ACP methyl ester carboxylesterase